jgi:membrane protease YdiL (CAAX protease family)
MTFPDMKTFDADQSRWGLGSALLVWLASVLLVLAVPLAAVMLYLSLTDPGALSSGGLGDLLRSDPRLVFVNIVAVFPAHLLTLLAAWAVVTRLGGEPFFPALGTEWGGFKAWHAAAILVGFFIVSLAVTSVLPEQEHELMRILRSSRATVYAVAVLATLTAPLVEEVVYRGVLYSSAQRSLGRWGAVALVTVLFALVHVPQYLPSYSTIILITILSLTLTLVRVWTRNLLPCIVLHLVFNGLQSLRLLAEPLSETGPPSGF